MNPGSQAIGLTDEAYSVLSGYTGFEDFASSFTKMTNKDTGEVFWAFNGDEESFNDWIGEEGYDDYGLTFLSYNYSTWYLGGN